MYSALIPIDFKNIITYKADKTHKNRFSEETQKAFVESFTGCFHMVHNRVSHKSRFKNDMRISFIYIV